MKKRNVTISLDEETARWARVEAARRDKSVSQMLAEMMGELRARDQSYETAMESYLSTGARVLKNDGGYPVRDAVHERADLRR